MIIANLIRDSGGSINARGRHDNSQYCHLESTSSQNKTFNQGWFNVSRRRRRWSNIDPTLG